MTISYSDDVDAAWLRKDNRAYYGYKIHVATDSRDGFVLGGHVTPANQSDTEEFVSVLDEVGARAGESIYADKGYSSQLIALFIARYLASAAPEKRCKRQTRNCRRTWPRS